MLAANCFRNAGNSIRTCPNQRIITTLRAIGIKEMDPLGFEPRAFRMRSGCDTTTP